MFDVNLIRKDFDMFKNNPDIIYFDNAATSFKPRCVIDKVVNFYESNTSNVHRGDYALSYRVSKEYDGVRKIVKDFINANDEKEIIYTSGASASLNLFAFGFARNYLKEGDVILTTLEEHASNILPFFKLQEEIKCKVVYIDLNEDGTFNLDNYRKVFEKENVKIVSLPYVSNVLGYINPLKEIINIAHEHEAIVNVDGAQAVPHLKVDVKDLDIDFMSFSSHKMCGPSGVGILYGKYDLLEKTKPLFYGGDSNARFEKNGELILKNIPVSFETGSPNIEGIIGFGEAIKYLDDIGLDNIHEYEKSLGQYLVQELFKLDNVTIYNPKTESGIVSFNIKNIFAQDAASYLSTQNICVRSGNHCAKLIHHVINTTESIRASLYFYNTKEEIDRFVSVVKETTIEKCIGVVI